MFSKKNTMKHQKVKHRSDLLMQKHMQLVHEVQSELLSALQQLDEAGDTTLIEQLHGRVARLNDESLHLLFSLQVMEKINTELMYAREDLDKALHSGVGNIIEARKRVIWLEDKMAEICETKKLQHQTVTNIPESQPSEADSQRTSDDIESIPLEQQYITDNEKTTEREDLNKQDQSGVGDTEATQEILDESDTLKDSLQQRGTESDGGDVTEERRDRTPSGTGREDHSDLELTEEPEHESHIYMTEVEGQMPEQDNSKLHVLTSNHSDVAAEYWQSEHHRFEYSQFADIFVQADPLSYHQVGLAVPGSFIQKEDLESEFRELPWRIRRKGSDIKDIHRIALDKLASKIHGLYDKIYNASQLSVRDWNQSKDSLRQLNTSQGNQMQGDLTTKSLPSLTKVVPRRHLQNTHNKMYSPLAQPQDKSSKAKVSVYYPKPIPPPPVLPITRTSTNKEYPRFADSFCKPDPDLRHPAQRIVDQRNLQEETKLNLYKEKKKPPTPGAAHLERKFQMMIETEGTSSTKSSGKKLRSGFKAAAVLGRLKAANTNSWNLIKPDSRGNEYSGLRWERVKTIVHVQLESDREEERIDAARQLGLLKSGDTMVAFALKEKLEKDPVQRVRYEAAKSLILLGCWDEPLLEFVLKYLVLGNSEVRGDLIQTISSGKNVQYISNSLPAFNELAKVLSHLCQNPDPDDPIAFHAAVCLGHLCVKDDHALARLMSTVKESRDTHIKAKALEILVKQMHVTNDVIIQHMEALLKESPVWGHRALACNLFISFGPKHQYVVKHQDKIYNLLETRLWDDPSMDVRLAAAKALTALGMFAQACDSVITKLEDPEEHVRAEAAMAVGTLGMKNEKVIRLLLEMLELDTSDYVRLMIIRSFRVLKLTDRRILRSLREREKLEGSLGRECGKALKILDQILTTQTLNVGSVAAA
ncbi:uncharacterized protein LOC131933275 [Physella acuta]|uniref:uncharacterized protein LOC131933275 n=1 Tax=Physella acuta TaxID=109671 RepID=UPI0027DB08CF|nr:uncharacterized protein LOC131933275 [Physella acuta]